MNSNLLLITFALAAFLFVFSVANASAFQIKAKIDNHYMSGTQKMCVISYDGFKSCDKMNIDSSKKTVWHSITVPNNMFKKGDTIKVCLTTSEYYGDTYKNCEYYQKKGSNTQSISISAWN